MTETVRIKLGNTTAYVYRTYKVSRKKKFRWCWCCCAPRRHKSTTSLEPTVHALKVYTTASDVDDSWAVLLLRERQQKMREMDQTSVYVYKAGTNDLMIRSKMEANIKKPINIDELPLKAEVVRKVLETSLINQQPLDSIVKLPDNRTFVVHSAPLLDDHDVLAGVLWTARRALNPEESDNLSLRQHAALYYEVESGTYVVNQPWLRQRALLGELLTKASKATVVLACDGMVENVTSLDNIWPLVVNPKFTKACSLEQVFHARLAALIRASIRYLNNTPNQGSVINGITMGGGANGYTVNVTKIVNNLTQEPTGYVVTLEHVESLAKFIGTLRSTSEDE